MWRCQHRAIFLWHLDRSCASLHTHIYLFFLFQSSVGEADVLLTGKIICSGGERKKKERGGGRWGGEGKNIWICKSCHSVEPCNEWEMLLPSFIMQRSLLNARQLGPDSSLWAPPPPSPPPPLPPFLLSSHSNLNQTTAWQHSSQKTHKCTQGTHKRYRYTTPGCLHSYKET